MAGPKRAGGVARRGAVAPASAKTEKHVVGDLKAEAGAVRAEVWAQGGAGPFRVEISPPSCAARLRLEANRLLVTVDKWGAPFEAGFQPDLGKLGGVVARKAGLASLAWEDMPATCSCPDASGTCAHVRAVVEKVRRKLPRAPVDALRALGFDLEEWAWSQEVLEAGTYPRQLMSCWDLDLATWQPRPLDGMPDLSAIPHLLEATLGRLAYSPFGEDFGELLRLGMLTAAKGVGKPRERMADRLLLRFPDMLDVAVNFGCGVATLAADNGDAPIEKDMESGELGKLFEGERGALLATMLDQVGPEDHGRLGGTDRYWAMLYRYVERLAEQCALVPELVDAGLSVPYRIVWRPATMLSAELRAVHARFVETCPPNLLRMRHGPGSPMRASPMIQVRHAVDILFRAILREGMGPEGSLPGMREDRRDPARMFFQVRGDMAYRMDADEAASVQGWLRRLAIPPAHPWLWAIFEPDRKDPETVLMHVLFADADGRPARLGKILAEHPTTWFVWALETVSRQLRDDLMATPEESQAGFDFPLDQYTDIFPRMRRMFLNVGARVDVEANLARMERPRVRYRMTRGKAPLAGRVDLSTLVDIDWGITIGDTFLDDRDSERVMRAVDAIRAKGRPEAVFMAGRHVLLDEDLRDVGRDADKARGQRLAHYELLRAALTGRHGLIDVVLDPPVRRLVKDMLSPRDRLPPPPGLAGTLRPHQRAGFEWLAHNADIGFGSVLADDTGLGKTLQAIALMSHRTSRDPSHKTLVVTPAALLANWAREIRRFAPGLRTQVVWRGGAGDIDTEAHDVIVVGHGTVGGADPVGSVAWGLLVVDEARNLKGLAPKAAKAIKDCKAGARVVLTGAPVDNSLDDLWDILECANPGYLGPRKTFDTDHRHSTRTDGEEAACARLRQLTGPFVLRRSRTARNISKELPERIEGREYCRLTTKQATLYRAVTKGMLRKIAKAGEGQDPRDAKRRGLVQEMLDALRRICDSPALHLGHDTATPSGSGKLALCLETLGRLAHTGEKAVVFTQYAAMGRLLVDAVRSATGEEPLFLHADLSKGDRDAVADSFRGDPARRNLVLSPGEEGDWPDLEVATQVIHFDRRWNPAAERQVTDCAHRAGQRRPAQVRLLVTEDTLEERVDSMLEERKELARLTVQDGETWLTEMTDDQLRELVEMAKPPE